MNLYLIGFAFLLFFLIELLYFKIANHYDIIDKPNHRSSHTEVTIRGGGIIFPIGLLLGMWYLGRAYPYFLLGLLLISAISFADDIKPVSSRIRIVFHLTAVALLFYQLKIYDFSFYWLIVAFIVAIGIINAVNFMDGINGLTGLYALITLISLFLINNNTHFTDNSYLTTAIIAVLVFLFFNFRNKAKCFAGDVGSVSIAFIMVFFIFQLIQKTENVSYILLLLVYGLDASTTMFFRLLRKENVFEAHRRHLYQFLVNEKRISHIAVALIYAAGQSVANIFLVFFKPSLVISLSILILSFVAFIALRFAIEGRHNLINRGHNFTK